MIKNLHAVRETWVRSLGWEDPWRRTWQPTPIFLPGESPWTEEPGGLQSMELQTVRYDRATKQSIAQQSSTTRYNFISCTLPPLCCSDLAPTSLSIQFRTENVYKPYSAIFHFMCSVLPLFIICQILYTPG